MTKAPRRQILPSSARYGSKAGTWSATRPEMTRSKDEPGQGQPQAIGADECDPIGVRFGTCARHHSKGKIKTNHSRTRARKAQPVAAGSCTNIRNRQSAHLSHHPDNLGLLKGDERISVAVVYL